MPAETRSCGYGWECIHVYHYDYRGSVIAVTDIDGNITDTLKYDAYGKVSERTGNSSLIFGYNGRYGVLTDPSGLLYMRTRYYSPDFKRFMSADIIDGSITDSTTLNVFAYVNGNPISFVDPFGLSAERGENVSSESDLPGLMYEGEFYPIYVPNHINATVELPWETVDSITINDWSFDGWQFVSGTKLVNFNGKDVYAGPVKVSDGYITNRDVLKKLGVFSFFSGILDSVSSSLKNTYINFEYQECGEQRRVIISAGSSDVKKTFNSYAGESYSMYWKAENGRVLAMTYAASIYHEFTGNDIGLWTYDIVVTVDKAHKGSGYSSYLWIDSDGTVMECPIIYPDDKVELGTRGFLGFGLFGFNSITSIPLNGSYPVSPEYQALFDKYM